MTMKHPVLNMHNG